MAGDWEKEKEVVHVDMKKAEEKVIESLGVEPNNHLIQFYEAIKPKEDEHRVKFIDPIFQDTHRLECTCGAKWSINEKEFEANDLKIQWHRSYAKRTATRVD